MGLAWGWHGAGMGLAWGCFSYRVIKHLLKNKLITINDSSISENK
jgi:hypothetical protein